MTREIKESNQLAALAGMLGPVLFVLVFTVEGWLRPSYNPVDTYISALSLGPRGWIQITNFVVFGLLLLLFARRVWRLFTREGLSRTGPVLLAVIAAFYTLSGPFVMDPMYTPQDQMSVHGVIHGALGGFVFLLMPISNFVFLRQINRVPGWRPLGAWTLGLGLACAAGVVIFTLSSKIPVWVDVFLPWQGLIQRLALVPFMAWVFVFGLVLYKHPDQSIS